MECQAEFFGLCYNYPTANADSSLFGFGEFIGALALLVIVYVVVDVRYKFRIAIAPGNLFQTTFYLIGFIGFSTLLTDVWIRERWLVSSPYISYSMWQGFLGAIFLLLAMTWIFYASLRPPIFSISNCKRFMQQLYQVILRGSERELATIADEFGRSADALVANCEPVQRFPPKDDEDRDPKKKDRQPNVHDYANHILLLIGNRKFCREMVRAAPISAIEVFQAIQKSKKYALASPRFLVHSSC